MCDATFVVLKVKCLSQTGLFPQECVPENLELKKKVFAQMDALASDTMILASSSSCIPASSFTEGLTHKENMLVAHPVGTVYTVQYIEKILFLFNFG